MCANKWTIKIRFKLNLPSNYLFKNRIWYKITPESWYAIKHQPTSQPIRTACFHVNVSPKLITHNQQVVSMFSITCRCELLFTLQRLYCVRNFYIITCLMFSFCQPFHLTFHLILHLFRCLIDKLWLLLCEFRCFLLLFYLSVVWGCRICRLHFCGGVRTLTPNNKATCWLWVATRNFWEENPGGLAVFRSPSSQVTCYTQLWGLLGSANCRQGPIRSVGHVKSEH